MSDNSDDWKKGRIMAARAEVAIIGGGAIGFSIAYHLAKQGVASQVIEMDGIASKASGKAWAAVGPPVRLLTFEGDRYPKDCLRPCLELASESYRRFPQLAAEVKEEGGVDPHYGEVTRIHIAMDEKVEKFLKERMVELNDEGFGLSWLGGEELRALGLGVSSAVRGGLLLQPHGAVVDAYRYVLALAQGAERCGASIKYGHAVDFSLRGHKVNSAVLGSGTKVGAEAVVIAMGPWSTQAASWLGVKLPLEPVRASCVKVEVPQRLPPYLLGQTWGTIVPKVDGSVVVGYIEETGVDLEDDRIREDSKNRMVDAAVRMVPRLRESKLVEARAGVLGYSPDGRPVLGRLPGWDNVYIAAGLGTLGILLSPAVGRVMADLIVKGRAEAAIGELSPERFL
ncbi:MAG: FAD-binding oxidoreductase [Dehalococcoidia bacterium]